MLPEWLIQVGSATPAPTHGDPTVWREACLESRPVLLASWLAEQSQPVVILTPSLARAEQWLAVLLRLGLPEERLMRLPSSLTPLLEPTGVEQETLHERLRALHALYRGEAVCILAPIAAALQRTMPPALFEAELVRLRLPDAEPPDTHEWLCHIAPDTLLRRLTEDGYEYQEPVRLPGHFARRGGIVDVFPMGAELPVRIEFWGDEIASLRLFEPATQRSIKQIRHAAIPPAREAPMGTPDVAERVRAEWEARIARQPAALQPTLRQNLEDDLRPLMQGAPFDRLELYLPWLLPARACLLDYLPESGWLVLDEPLMLNTAYDRALEELSQSLRSRAERGDIPPLQPDEYMEPFTRVVQHRACLLLGDPMLAGGKPFPATRQHELGTRALRTAGGTVADLWQRVYRWQQAGYKIVIATDRPTQVRKALQEASLEGSVELFQGNLGGGFVWDAEKFALLTDGELFESHRLRLPPRRFTEGVPITSIMDLQPGDYVVHIYHGVGVFRGLTTLERDGVKREYLLIEYAHPDRIFVPVDQLDRIQKYLAPDDKPPEIKRLNSLMWARTVARARQKAKEVAEELVRIYALREKATRPPYGEDAPWQAEMEAMFPYIETDGQTARDWRGQSRLGVAPPDGQAADWRCRLRQDGGRPARGVQGNSGRTAGRAHVPHHHPGVSALPDLQRAVRAVRRASRPVEPPNQPRRAEAHPARAENGRGGHGHRHAPPAKRRCAIQKLGAGHHRRRAALRRDAEGEVQEVARHGRCVVDERNAHPAHAVYGADRDSRHEHDYRPAARQAADTHHRRALHGLDDARGDTARVAARRAGVLCRAAHSGHHACRRAAAGSWFPTRESPSRTDRCPRAMWKKPCWRSTTASTMCWSARRLLRTGWTCRM
jgi:hypothetical protein